MEMKRAALAALGLLAVAVVVGYAAFMPAATSGGFVRGVYGAPPRSDNGSIDYGKLRSLLAESRCDTFNYLVTDPLREYPVMEEVIGTAEGMGVDVWMTFLPPSEMSAERRSDINYVDYVGMARRAAQLSLSHPNVKAFSIDNALNDPSFFTPAYLTSIRKAARDVNPAMRFIPVVYYGNVMAQGFPQYADVLDGIQFYYTHFPEEGVSEKEVFEKSIADVDSRFSGPVYLGIYATPWSKDYPTTAAYVGELLNLARQHTDGAMIYTMNQEGEKMEVIAEAFGG